MQQDRLPWDAQILDAMELFTRAWGVYDVVFYCQDSYGSVQPGDAYGSKAADLQREADDARRARVPSSVYPRSRGRST